MILCYRGNKQGVPCCGISGKHIQIGKPVHTVDNPPVRELPYSMVILSIRWGIKRAEPQRIPLEPAVYETVVTIFIGVQDDSPPLRF